MLRLDKFARYPLTFGPTPIEHLPRLTAALGGKVQIYAKRDDCNSGLALGGNKLRKLEYVVPEHWVPHDAPVYDRVGNILLTRLMGADSRIVDAGFDIGIRKSWEDAIQSVKDAGGRPYAIPAGASVHKFGALGYVRFAEEVAMQERELQVTFDYIIVCVVTGSTLGGMIVGFAA